MSITYSLIPTQLDCLPQIDGKTDVVVRVHWAYTGNNGTQSAGLGGITELIYDPSQHAFIPYAELTREQISDWVLNSWSTEQLIANMNIINEQLNIVVYPLPWNNPVSQTINEESESETINEELVSNTSLL